MTGNSHSTAHIQKINDFINRYNRKARSPISNYDFGGKKVEDDFFDLMLAVDPISNKSRIVAAYERARAIHKVKKANGAESNESVTTIYELLYELGVIEDTKNGLNLFRK